MATPLPSPTTSPLSSLIPVRLVLHPFLDALSAARLMQAGGDGAALLRGYAFFCNIPIPSRPSPSTPLLPFFPLYERFGLHVPSLRLTPDFDEPLVDSATGRSRLPSSLKVLCSGSPVKSDLSDPNDMNAPGDDYTDEGEERQWMEDEDAALRAQGSQEDGEAGWDPHEQWPPWDTSHMFPSVFDQPLVADSLPPGLVRLHLNSHYQGIIAPGALPDSLRVLELGWRWPGPLLPGVLPPNLRRLVLHAGFWEEGPLQPGVLPSSLRFLQLGRGTKLQMGSLPEGLRGLYLPDGTWAQLSPGVLPSTLTHLYIGFEVSAATVDIVPPRLQFLVCPAHSELMRVNMFPSSLRALCLYFGLDTSARLAKGVIPHNVELLELVDYHHPLRPGIIPSSVVLVRLLTIRPGPVLRGSMPSSVRWVKLSREYQEDGLVEEGAVPATARVEYID